MTETPGVVTSAAAVMVSVFAVFATLSMLEMKQMGVGRPWPCWSTRRSCAW